MTYTLLFQKTDTVANFNGITTGTGAITLTTGNFSVSGTQLYVIDYDTVNAEVVSATVSGTTLTIVARGLDNTSAVTHTAGCNIGMMFVPSHYGNGLGKIAANDGFTTYTPTLSQGASSDISKTVTFSKTYTLGKLLVWQFRLAITGAGTAGSAITLTTPSTLSTGNGVIGTGNYTITGGGASYSLRILIATTGTIQFADTSITTASALLGATPNFATQNGDVIQGFIMAEIA